MDGVTILAQEEIHSLGINTTAFWVAFTIAFILIGAFIVWGIIETGENAFVLLFLLALMASLLFGIVIGAAFGDTEYAYTKYKVTIDESVSMTDFYEKYEILDQDGLIFTVREK